MSYNSPSIVNTSIVYCQLVNCLVVPMRFIKFSRGSGGFHGLSCSFQRFRNRKKCLFALNFVLFALFFRFEKMSYSHYISLLNRTIFHSYSLYNLVRLMRQNLPYTAHLCSSMTYVSLSVW